MAIKLCVCVCVFVLLVGLLHCSDTVFQGGAFAGVWAFRMMFTCCIWNHILKSQTKYCDSAERTMPSVLWRCWLGSRKGIRPVKNEWWGAGMVICLEQGADLHMAQLIPLPLTVWCLASLKSRLVLPFRYRLTWVVPERGPLNGCVCAERMMTDQWSAHNWGGTMLMHFAVTCWVFHAGLQNDHKELMKQIEVKLHELHAQSRSDATADPMEVNGEHHAVNYVAFARIDHVDDGSPASSAVTESYVIWAFCCHTKWECVIV